MRHDWEKTGKTGMNKNWKEVRCKNCNRIGYTIKDSKIVYICNVLRSVHDQRHSNHPNRT